ncbi:DUF5615 family PIN-like protein [Sphingomonas sp. PB4P5]|uniref:DUF5615 family PIN-like protein n=1 Tax=Parasphingomonas puruogangriensis TaxID=3096155 RepID=UPI002FC779DF
MRFTIDENVPLIVARALRALDHDCLVIAEADPAAHDDDIMGRSRNEDRILVTFDADFSRMIFHELQPPPPGVVYMRGRPDQALLVSQTFIAMFGKGALEPRGRFIVIEPSGDVRSLPLGIEHG